MRKLALILCLALWPGLLLAGLPQGVPSQPSQAVTDLAGMLSADASARLNAALAQVWQQGKFQLAVLTLPSLDGAGIEDVSIQVARAWGLGSKEQGNGVLLLVAPSEHRMRIEVGSRLEGDLTDAACSRIINEVMAPRLREGDNDGAVLAGCQAIAGQLGVELSGMASIARPAPVSRVGIALIIKILFVLAFLGLRIFGGRRGSGLGWFAAGTLLGSSGSGGGGYSSGGGFSGGGGGFSGGGASGGW
jgi:uncharacterized protein